MLLEGLPQNAPGEILATRVSMEQARAGAERFANVRWNSRARTLRVGLHSVPLAPEAISSTRLPRVSVVSAGTTDAPVAEEALETLAWMGFPTRLIQDIGVAGPYRLLAHLDTLRSSAVLVVVAGMEGALPSVVAGQVSVP